MERIPKIIHYCWFGRGSMPKLAGNGYRFKDCVRIISKENKMFFKEMMLQ